VPTTVPEVVQAVSLKMVYVTVPPAWNPLDIVAVSWTEVPTAMEVTAAPVESLMTVPIVGLALLTVRGSQLLVAALLLASPLKVAEKP